MLTFTPKFAPNANLSCEYVYKGPAHHLVQQKLLKNVSNSFNRPMLPLLLTSMLTFTPKLTHTLLDHISKTRNANKIPKKVLEN